MSFNGLHYDSCHQYKSALESLGPGQYMLGTPMVNGCGVCYSSDPYIRLQQRGSTAGPNAPADMNELIDIDSDMRGLGRLHTRCPGTSYAPRCEGRSGSASGYPCGQGVAADGGGSPEEQRGPVKGYSGAEECGMPTDNTRLSNPPATLRGTEWKRWDFTCKNPQQHALVPFDHMIQSRIIVKDNHRPLLREPADQSATLPNGGADYDSNANGFPTERAPVPGDYCARPDGTPSVYAQIANYGRDTPRIQSYIERYYASHKHDDDDARQNAVQPMRSGFVDAAPAPINRG